MRCGGRTCAAEAVAEDKAGIASALVEHLRRVPTDARYYGVTIDERGEPDTAQARRAADSAVMVRVRLC